jgi:hypothetical protein
MSDNAQFNAALPKPYKNNWKEAYRADTTESPRMASYRAPGGEAIPFIRKSFRFSGGQSQDTAEYPFGGLWSNAYLNEKPQSLNIEGFLRGPTYISRRNRLIEALRIPTDDDTPGYIDLPFWGRFPVVVSDKYEVSEDSDEQGQCKVSITFTRAGVSITERAGHAGSDATRNTENTGGNAAGNAERSGGDITGRTDALPSAANQLESATAQMEASAIENFAGELTEEKIDKVTFAAAFGHVKTELLSIIGRIQGAQTFLNAMTAEVPGIINLIDRGIRLPGEPAQTLFNAGASIVGGIKNIKNSVAMYGKMGNMTSFIGISGSGGAEENETSGTTAPSLPPPDNEKNVLVLFLSAGTYTLPVEAATVSREATKAAIENLYKIMAFSVSAQLIANMDSLTYKKAGAYRRLMEKPADSINRENPNLYAAIRDMRIALSMELSSRELSREMTRTVSTAAPLLYPAYYLGCNEEKIRELNGVADSFVVKGDVIYV